MASPGSRLSVEPSPRTFRSRALERETFQAPYAPKNLFAGKSWKSIPKTHVTSLSHPDGNEWELPGNIARPGPRNGTEHRSHGEAEGDPGSHA